MGQSRCGALAGAALLVAVCAAGPALAISDQRDFQPMYSALKDLMGFAAPGRSVNWGNPETGGHGTITVVRRADQDGLLCWEYERSYNQGSGMRAVTGVACELETGFWQILDRNDDKAVATAPPQAVPQQQAPQVATKPTAPAKRYDSYNVRQAQSLLTELGYEPGPVDGAFGRRTRVAIEQFEEDKGFPVSGEPTPALIVRLREATRTATAQPAAPTAPSEALPEPAPPPTVADAEPPQMLLAEPPEPAIAPSPIGGAPSAAAPSGPAPAPSGSGSSGLAPPPPPPPPPAE